MDVLLQKVAPFLEGCSLEYSKTKQEQTRKLDRNSARFVLCLPCRTKFCADRVFSPVGTSKPFTQQGINMLALAGRPAICHDSERLKNPAEHQISSRRVEACPCRGK